MYQNVPQQNRVLSGVMDQDSAPFEVRPENYRYALNVENTYISGHTGAQTNTKGFLEIGNPALPGGTNKCIGSYEDIVGDSIIYFVWNSTGYHGIYRWIRNKAPYTNGVIETIWRVNDPSQYSDVASDPLNFKEFSLINGVNLVEGKLYWTDGDDQPKCIDIVKANLTNKFREFNIYFSPIDNTTETRTYTLEVYQQGIVGAVTSVVWSSNAPATYASRVADFMQNVNSSYFSTYDNGDYVTVRMNFPGVWYVRVTNDSTHTDRVLPNNFYPDLESGLTYGFGAMPTEGFYRAKKNPFDGPDAQYTQSVGAGNYSVHSPSAILDGAMIWPAKWLGIDNKSTLGYFDTQNNVTLGAWANAFDSTGSIQYGPSAYLSVLVSSSLKINFDVTLTPTNIYAFPSLSIYLTRWNGSTQTLVDTIYTTSSFTIGVPITVNYSKTISAVSGEQYGIVFVYPNVVLNTVPSQLSGTVKKDASISNFLVENAFNFRGIFQFKDYAKSVYSAYSTVPLPLHIDTVDTIEVDFTDKWITQDATCSELLSVTLSLSTDGGLTWNDFKKFTPPQFTCAGSTVYNYTGNDTLIPVDSKFAALEYSDVPIRVNSQAYIDDRIFDFGFTEGYDNVKMNYTLTNAYDILYGTEYTTYNPYPSIEGFAIGDTYGLGVVYYDDYDRSSGVQLIPDSTISIWDYSDPTHGVGQLTLGARRPYVEMRLFNEPPSWATKYRIVRTKSLSKVGTQFYTSNDAWTGSSGAFVINIENIAYAITQTPTSQVGFPFQPGGRIRLIADNSGVCYTFVYDGKITAVTATTVTVDMALGFTPAKGTVFMGYEPASQTDVSDQVYYETGPAYEIGVATFNGVRKYYHKGDTQDQSYGTTPSNTVTPALVNVYHGGVYYRRREFYWDTNATPSHTPYFVYDLNAYQFSPTAYDDTGRVKSVNPLGQTYFNTGVRFSDQYYAGTQRNGLPMNQPLNYVAYNVDYGDATKAQVVNNDVLRLIFSKAYQVSVYVNQGIIRQAQGGSNLVSVSDQVAGNTHIIERNMGTVNGESVVQNDEGDMFGWDQTQGKVFRSSGNGLLEESKVLMKTTFRDYGVQRMRLDQSKSICPAVYDLSKDLYILTLGDLPAKEFVAPQATVELFDNDTKVGISAISVKVIPSNLILFQTSVISTNSLNALVENGINTYGTTFTAIVDDGGRVVITAPSTFYGNATVQVSVRWTDGSGTHAKIYSGVFSSGQDASGDDPFTGVTLAYNKGIDGNDRKRGWVNYYSFVPEMYGRLRNTVVSFKDGKLWLHEAGTTRNFFYDVQYDSKIRFVLNKDYPKVKMPLSVWYRGKGAWGAKLTVAPSDSYPLGMETQMAPELFRLENDGYYASVLRNSLDPRFTDPTLALVNGDAVTGATVDCELYSSDTSEARIDSNNILYMYDENS